MRPDVLDEDRLRDPDEDPSGVSQREAPQVPDDGGAEHKRDDERRQVVRIEQEQRSEQDPRERRERRADRPGQARHVAGVYPHQAGDRPVAHDRAERDADLRPAQHRPEA